MVISATRSNLFYRRGIEYPLFEIVLKFLTVRECQTKFSRVCRQWKHLDFRMFCSYSSFKAIENGRFTAKELKVVLKKGSKSLPHIRVYKEIIRRDFCNNFQFFNQNISMEAKVAGTLLTQIKASSSKFSTCMVKHEEHIKTHKFDAGAACGQNDNQYRLYSSFKIKALGVGSTHNFLSDKSLIKICLKSRYSMEDLALKNALQLSNSCLSESIS
jgi:hypothetical protein